MKLGTCYYPEHWPEETWQQDAKRMKALGLTWVRIGEFAWSRIEPRDGQLELDWLDRSIDILGNAGLQVVLGTPTPTPPKWLIDKYDDVLQVDEQNRVRKFGSRRHYCFNSTSYRQETERIVTLLAERYSKYEAVQAWQTDNEYGCHDTIRCYCENCERAFRGWLEQKYGKIDALNEAWWNVFWSMEYGAFEEVELPNLTVTEANPSHNLDFYRFSSDSVVDYDKLQIDLIRQHSDKPITHNAMIYFSALDYHKLAEKLRHFDLGQLPAGDARDQLPTRKSQNSLHAHRSPRPHLTDARPLLRRKAPAFLGHGAAARTGQLGSLEPAASARRGAALVASGVRARRGRGGVFSLASGSRRAGVDARWVEFARRLGGQGE